MDAKAVMYEAYEPVRKRPLNAITPLHKTCLMTSGIASILSFTGSETEEAMAGKL